MGNESLAHDTTAQLDFKQKSDLSHELEVLHKYFIDKADLETIKSKVDHVLNYYQFDQDIWHTAKNIINEKIDDFWIILTKNPSLAEINEQTRNFMIDRLREYPWHLLNEAWVELKEAYDAKTKTGYIDPNYTALRESLKILAYKNEGGVLVYNNEKGRVYLNNLLSNQEDLDNLFKNIKDKKFSFTEYTSEFYYSLYNCLRQAISAVTTSVLCNQKMNAYFVELADICGIKKKISSHTGLHSFATSVALANGVSIENVAKRARSLRYEDDPTLRPCARQKYHRDMTIVNGKFTLPAANGQAAAASKQPEPVLNPGTSAHPAEPSMDIPAMIPFMRTELSSNYNGGTYTNVVHGDYATDDRLSYVV